MQRPIEIIPLARKKLQQRGIKESWVVETITTPEQIVEGHGGRSVAQRKYELGGKQYLLRIVFEDKTSYVVIVTAYLTSQIARYWKE